jgi:hypothetical protein
MQFIEQIRTRLHHSFLKKEISNQRNSRSSMYLDNAASVGILFDGTELDDRETIVNYAEKLKKAGKKVTLLAFFDNKLKSEDFTFKHFNRQQLDFALRPKSRDVLEFAEQRFDLLLNLSNRNILPLDYIAAHSKAKFRVGPFTEKTFCYDLMIEHSGKKDLGAFIQQVVFYLKKMRPDYEAAAI